MQFLDVFLRFLSLHKLERLHKQENKFYTECTQARAVACSEEFGAINIARPNGSSKILHHDAIH